ncbi:hypothetical protein Tco_0339870 [Tanacetum coccineum]
MLNVPLSSLTKFPRNSKIREISYPKLELEALTSYSNLLFELAIFIRILSHPKASPRDVVVLLVVNDYDNFVKSPMILAPLNSIPTYGVIDASTPSPNLDHQDDPSNSPRPPSEPPILRIVLNPKREFDNQRV